ncbi:monovalent cation/H(+) antiporter subunit G [Actinomadura sp. 7K534]|uniref:monovalent cation/H(+) antiporter subunit G n=1 Tax=Actinomadura sp. 7K534 TaxID=2530366 RepID=UPI001049208B|nr:monovalent cation/H(+) antiporter subunit G [Actinomadura sp. 7K534]TDB92280.1 monovalent cation/H(+) antiporter subunit G [Actinomadura sp. 7K534]
MSIGDVITAVLLPVGAAFSALGALGALRFPDLHTRLHAATKPQTIGLLLILGGVAPQAGSVSAAAPLLLVGFFQLLTAPVTAQTVGGAAYRAGVIDRATLTVDESRREGEDGPWFANRSGEHRPE